MKIKACKQHQMAFCNDRWHSFYFILNQLISLEITEFTIEFGTECPYCSRFKHLER